MVSSNHEIICTVDLWLWTVVTTLLAVSTVVEQAVLLSLPITVVSSIVAN